MFIKLFYAFFQSITFALIVGVFFKLKLFVQLRKIHGNYIAKDFEGNQFDDKKYEVIFGLRNLFSFNSKLIIKQISESKGNWVSTFNVTEQNPLFLSGYYRYTTKYDEWGLHNVQLNLNEEEIFVNTEARNRESAVSYLLKKEV